MRVLAVAAAALVLAAPAQGKPDPQLAALKKQVAALTQRVKQLETKAELNRQLAVCYYALNQDSIRTVFQALSLLTEAVTGRRVPAWDAIERFNDQGACSAVGIPRP